MHCFRTHYVEVLSVSPLGADSVVYLSRDQHGRRELSLSSLNPRGNNVCVILSEDARSVAGVTLAGNLCAALSYWYVCLCL